MDQTLIVFIVAIFSSIVSPLVLVSATAFIHRKERAEDFKRQDAVAAKAAAVAVKAETAAELLSAAQQVTITNTEDVRVAAASSAADTKTQLKQIHTLVNSDKTAAMQALLDQTQLTLVGLREIVALVKKGRGKPTAATLSAIETAEEHIAQLTAELVDREHQAVAVEAEKQKAATSAPKDGQLCT